VKNFFNQFSYCILEKSKYYKMKQVIKSFVLVLSLFSMSINAQINKQQSEKSNEVIIAGIKADFVQSQQYLNPSSSFKSVLSFNTDSLAGFDEAASKVRLLSSYFYGAEFTHAMNTLKRQYIINKYNLYGSISNNNSNNNSSNKQIGGPNNVFTAPCVNEDFEATAPGQYLGANSVNGWTVMSTNNGFPGAACTTPLNGAAGSPEFWIVSTPLLDPNIGTLPNSPLGGTRVAKLQDNNMGSLVTQIRQTFPVTAANSLYQYAYAGAWDGSGHSCCDQPGLKIDLFDCAGLPLGCSSISLTPTGPNCAIGVPGYTVDPITGFSWTNWTVKYVDLTPYIGTCVTIRVTNCDCNGGAHFGYTYFDSKCGGNIVGNPVGGGVGGSVGGPVSFCAGSSAAGIVAPLGYATYSWTGPPGVTYTPALANTPSISVSPVTVGQVFTVTMVTASGCFFTAVDTIQISNAFIQSIATVSTCPGGASGAATIVASGSSSGYTYSYTCLSNPGFNLSAINTPTVANLQPGIYSTTITGGGGSCGVASATFQIGISPPNVNYITVPYCGTTAFLTTTGGTNFQWYNNLTPIPGPAGTASGYTVTAPVNGAIYALSYTSPQGCQDSIRYTLQQSNSQGTVGVQSIGLICTAATNGTASIVITPANNAPTGFNTYSVFSTPLPTYTAVLAPTSSNTFVPTGLSAGTYSVIAFDGSCFYNTSFTVNPYVLNYTLTPVTSTICQGNSATVSVNLGNVLTGTPCSTLGVGLACNTPNQTILGTGVAFGTMFSFPSPYARRWNDSHQQYLYRASELTALGIQAGYLTSLAFNVVNTNFVGTLQNYTIKMKCTGAIQATTFDMAGLTTVFVGAAVTPVLGWNQHTFATPYYWDGVSNLVVDICFNFSPFTTANVSSPFTTTPFTSCIFNFAIGGGSTCGTAVSAGTSANRPNTRFGNCPGVSSSQFTYSWTPATFLSSTNASVSVASPTTAPGTTNSYNYSVVVTPTFVNCPVTSTFTVVVSNPITPTITPINPICNTALPVTITVSPTGGTFSTGIAGGAITPTSGIISPNLAAIGTNTFMYAVGVGSCLATQSGSFSVSQFNTANITGTVATQCVSMPLLNLNAIVQSTTNGVWTGAGVSGTYSFNPAGLATGVYNLTYNTTSNPNATLCPDTRTIAISVLSPITPTITQVGPFCNNSANVTLAVSPNTGSWTTSGFLNALGVFSPTNASIGQNIVQYVVGTNTCNAQQTKTINVEAFVPALITGNIPDKCNTNSVVNLSPLATNVLGTWSGPGVTGFNFDPTTSGTGSLVLNYNTASSPSGLCPDNASLTVNVFSLAAVSISQEGPFCSTFPALRLKVTPVGGTFGGYNNNFVVNSSGLFTPAFADIGGNTIGYTVTAGPCTSIGTTTINIEKFVSADFISYAGPFCKNDLPVNLNSYVQNPGGTWTGPATVNGVFTPANANIGDNNFIIYQTHSLPTASLCPDTAATRIRVSEIPNITLLSNLEKGCLPLQVIFNTPSANSGSGLWNFGDGETAEGFLVTHIYNTPGTYSVTFNYDDNIACATQAALLKPINVFALPIANFVISPQDEITVAQPEVQLYNQSTVLGNNTYQWQIGNLYQLNETNPKIIFPTAGNYIITLTATTTEGCVDKVNKVVTVKNDYGVYIPTSFSPNSDDLNDVFIPIFSPYGVDLKSGYDFEIFDRWGHSLFHTNDFAKGWNGTFQNNSGDALKQDIYVYKIRYKDLDGKTHDKIGYVSLIK
jgi:gliding motility-associated-like protein